MKWFRMITGVLLFTSSVAGDATGKVGKNGFGIAEWGSQKGQSTASFVHDTTHGMADAWTQNGWTENSIIDLAADVAYISSDLSNSAGELLSAAERASARGKVLCEGVEQYSRGLNDYANDLLDQRKNEYRDLKLDFDWRGRRVSSQIDEEDWVLVNEFPTKSKLEKNRADQVFAEDSEVFFDAVEYQE